MSIGDLVKYYDKQKEPDKVDIKEWERFFNRHKKAFGAGAIGAIVVGGAIILAPETGGLSLAGLALVP